MPQLKFFDMKAKKSFTTDKFKIVKRGKRNFAVTTAPSGVESWRIVGKDFAMKYK